MAFNMKLPDLGIKAFFKALIQNGNGHSSKSAIYLAGAGTACACVLLITLYLGYDMWLNGKIDTDMLAVSALITSYAAFAVGIAYPKVSAEKSEKGKQTNA